MTTLELIILFSAISIVIALGVWGLHRESRMLSTEQQDIVSDFVAPLRYVMNILRWAIFVWGCISCIIMVYYAVQLHLQGYRPDGFEFWIGVIAGFPSWIGSPLLVALRWRHLSRSRRTLFVAPLIFAILVLVVVIFLSNVLSYQERHLIL